MPVMLRNPGRFSVGRDHILNVIEVILDPLVLVLSQWAVAVAIEGRLTPQDVILSVVVFSLTFPGPARLTMPTGRAIRSIVLSWATLSGLLFLFGYASRYLWDFDSQITADLVVGPLVSLLGAHFLLKAAAPSDPRTARPGALRGAGGHQRPGYRACPPPRAGRLFQCAHIGIFR